MGETAEISIDLRPITLSVVVMAFNEEENLPVLLPRLKAWLDGNHRISEWEVVVVDDGSQDRTARTVLAQADSEPRFRLVRHSRNRGMGAAIRSGYNACRLEYVTQLPADLQVPPEVLDRFLRFVPSHDIVVSVYEDRGDDMRRRVLAAGYRTFARVLLGQRADYTGTMMFRREWVDRIRITTDSFVANLEFPLKMLNLGARSCLVRFTPSPRLHGESKVANMKRIRFVATELVALRLRGLKF